jgi:4-hydroxy-tetrahydrodipicolinate synthase
VALCEHAVKAGVDSLLVVTSYYVRPPQRGLVEYYVDLGRRFALPLPIYHIPGRIAVSVEIDTLARIAEKVPHFAGIKHAVNDLGFVREMLQHLGADFRIFVDLEELSFPMMAVGAAGMMNAVGNIAPRKVSDLYLRGREDRVADERRLHFDLFELNSVVFFDTNPIAVKYMMKRMGLIANMKHRLSMMPVTPETEARLDAVLERAGLISSAAA